MAAAVAARTAVEVVGAAVARTSLAAAGTAVAVIGMVEAGIMLVLAGMGVTGMAIGGMAGVPGVTVVTAADGELAPR